MGFKEWVKAKERKKELKKQIEGDSLKFTTAIGQAATAAGNLTGLEREQALARVKELRDTHGDVRLVTDLEQKATRLAQTVRDAQQLVLTFTAPPTRARSSDQPPPRPQPVSDALRKLVGDVDTVRQAVVAAGLTAPAMLTSAIAAGNLAIAPNNTVSPGDVSATRQKLTEIVESRDSFLGFVDTWKKAEVAEQQNRLALPDPKALYTPLESTWTNDLDLVRLDFAKMADLGGVDAPLERLAFIQTRLARKRQELTGLQLEATRRIDEVAKRIADLGNTKIYNLVPSRALLEQARNAFIAADTADKLAATMNKLQEADVAVNSAKSGLDKPKSEALALFNKQRRVLVDQLAAAKLVRGALDPKSEVAKYIAGIELMMRDADSTLAGALDSGTVVKATGQIEKAISLDVAKAADKLGKGLKKQAEDDLAALPEYQKLFDQLTSVRAEVAKIPGGHVQLQEADALLALTRVEGSGKPAKGFTAAVALLKQSGIALLKTRAETAATTFVDSSLSPKAKAALELASNALLSYKSCHPPFLGDTQQRALASASQQPEPIAALTTLKDALVLATTTQTNLKRDQGLRVQVITERLKTLGDAGLSGKSRDLIEMNLQLTAARTDLDDWRVDEAKTRLDTLDDLSTQVKTAFDLAKTEWTLTAGKLTAPRERLSALSKATGALGNLAAGGVSDINTLLTNVQKGGVDFREAVAAANRILADAEKLEAHAQGIGFVANFDMGAFKTASDKLMVSWKTLMTQVEGEIEKLDLALKAQGIKSGAASGPWSKDLGVLESERTDANSKLLRQPGEDPTTALARVHAGLVQRVNALLKGMPDPTKTTEPLFTDAVEAGKKNDILAAYRNAWQIAEQTLNELKQLSANDQTALQAELGVFEPGQASAESVKKYSDLAKTILKLNHTQREETKKNKAPAIKEAGKLKDELGKKLFSNQSVLFRGLFDDLGSRVDDALAMLETEDVSLITAAKRQIAEIRLTLDDARGKGNEGGATLDQVQAACAELSHTLGDDGVVQRRLPQTYKQLKARLDAAIEIARRLPPDKGLPELVKLREPIGQARELALQTQVRYDGFKLTRAQLEAQFDKMKDHTGATLLGGRAKAYNERFESRVKDIHALARQEGQLDSALTALQTMETELKNLLAMPPDAAREKLQGLNAEAEVEQRELRDLARNWNTTQDHWVDTLLPAVEKAVAGRDEDDTEVESLKAAINSISKTLDPYLAVVSMVPHKRGLSNGAPDMKAARAAFAQAYMRIAQMNKVAARLRDGASSTNVELESDLEKLEQEWVRRVTDARNTLSQLSDSITRMPTKVSTKTDDPHFLNPQDLTTLTESVNQLRPLMEKLSGRLSATAFSAPFGVLRKKTTTEPERKKAREEALRTVRRIRADIVDNDLFKQLFTGAAQGMLEIDPRPPISFLRASLKKVELAALVGI